MYVYKLPNADAAMITVSSTASTLQTFIEAAASADYVIGKENAIDIVPEDGDIRVYFDENTPTAAKGILLRQGGYYAFRGVPLVKMKLIRVSGDVSCSIQIGVSEPGEGSSMGVPSSLSGISVTADTEFPAAAALTDDFANPTTTSVAAMGMVWDGAAWDRLLGDETDGLLVNLGSNNDITGTVTANLSATDNAVLDAIAASLALLDDAISGSEIQADIVGALPAGTNAIGKLAANSGVDIGDVDVTSVVNDSLNGPESATGPVIDSYTSTDINAAAGTANQSLVAAPGANKQIWVYGISVTADAAGTISFQDEDDTAVSGVMPVAANGGFAHSPSGNFAMPLWKVATNKALEVDTVTCALDGSLSYAIVDVS